jgi:hypothetical protein
MFGLYVLGAVVLQVVLSKRLTSRWCVSFILSHTAVLLLVTSFVAKDIDDGQVKMLWLPMQIIDFPVSMLKGRMCPLVRSIFGDSYFTIVVLCPLLYLALFGTIQSAVIGKYLDGYFRRMNANEPASDQRPDQTD